MTGRRFSKTPYMLNQTEQIELLALGTNNPAVREAVENTLNINWEKSTEQQRIRAMHDYQQVSYAMASMAGMVRARNDLNAELTRRDTGMELQDNLAAAQAENTELRRELHELRQQHPTRKAS